MSQEQAWALGEMAHAIVAERLAEAQRDGLAQSVRGKRPSPRALLAAGLRSLAALIDGEPGRPARQEHGLVRLA